MSSIPLTAASPPTAASSLVPAHRLNNHFSNEISSFLQILAGDIPCTPCLSRLGKHQIRDLTLKVFSLSMLPRMTLTIFKVEEAAKQNLLQSVNLRYGEKTKEHLLELFQPNQPIQARVFRDIVEEIINTDDVETAKFLFVQEFISSGFAEFLNFTNDAGETALTSAISEESQTDDDLKKNIEITLLLIHVLKNHKEAFNTPDDYGKLPSHFAAKDARKIEVFEALVEADATINSETLMIAAKAGNTKALSCLIEREKSRLENPENLWEPVGFNAQGPADKTALMLAVEHFKEEAIQALSQEDFVDLEIPSFLGYTPLQYLFQEHIIQNSLESFCSCSLILLQNGANPNLKAPGSFYDQTLLMKACENLEAIDVVQTLVFVDAEINVKDNAGNTALMWAVQNNNVSAVSFLLEKGADRTIENNEKETALDLANSLNSQDGYSQEIVDLLKPSEEKKRPSHKRGKTLLNRPIPLHGKKRSRGNPS